MNNDDNLERYLRTYYLRFYPHDLIIKWLSYSKADGTLANREFAFILRDDVHIRFLSFNNANEFSAKLMEKVPYKIDIGAVYNRPPRDRKQVGEFMPIQRELVFDIDLTDYDSIRNCCKDANVCSKCWRWITIAVTVLEKLLKDHFGFASLLWVFSGRRGIHCWVADHQARSLSNKAREAVAKYLIFDKKGTAINKHRVHPVVEDAYDIIAKSPEFEKLVLEQGWLNSREHWASILRLCSEEMAKKIDTAFENLSSAKLRFELLMSNKLGEKENWKDGADLSIISGESDRNFLRYFVMEYAYPRLDEKVTTGLNHLLKLPFTVHPKTGKIAVPLNAKLISNLDLEQLPQVVKLTTELIENSAKQKVYRRSSLAPYIEGFEDFIDGLNKHQ